jgi:hypothetical protein
MTLTKKDNDSAVPLIFVCLAVVIGSFIRLAFMFGESFPLNDGGMFYTMTRDLIANGFEVPAFTTYNNLSIPFAYPPLQFYVAGLLSTLFKWELLDIFRLLPAIVCCMTIPAFFLLARELLHNDLHTSLATLIFAFIPASFDWLIMGGGITRAPAFLFALLALTCIYKLYTLSQKRYIFLSALLASLAVLSHPETALHTAASALMFFLFFGRNKAGIIRSLIVAVLVLVFTAFWWLPVLVTHGLTPFLAAGSTGWHNILSVFNLLFANQLSEYQITPITVLYLIGLFIHLAQRKFFLPVWFFVIFIAEPRSAPLFLSPVIAIFASYTLIQLMNLLNGLEKKPGSETDLNILFSGTTGKILFAIFFAQWVFSAYATVINLSQAYFLGEHEMQAFTWVRENTPYDSRFLVITGNAPLTDPASEWFPTLTGRTSQGTAQGHEWIMSDDFQAVLQRSLDLQLCANQAPECLAAWSENNSLLYDYLFIEINTSRLNSSGESFPYVLSQLLLDSADYRALYNSDGIMVFEKISK